MLLIVVWSSLLRPCWDEEKDKTYKPAMMEKAGEGRRNSGDW